MALAEALSAPGDLVRAAEAQAEHLNLRYQRLSSGEVLADAIHGVFPGRIALVSSFGAESVVLLHLVAEVDRDIPVVFIDTGKIFGSTLRYRDAIAARLGLTQVLSAKPDPVALAAADADASLWMRDPDKCCAIRKVAPLARSLAGYDAWISGRKRFQGGLRAELPLVEADGEQIKINPLAAWTREDVERYRERHDLPEHPLVADGFRSIGCMPCTTRVGEGEDERSGRWRGLGKAECGIHLGLKVLETDGSGI